MRVARQTFPQTCKHQQGAAAATVARQPGSNHSAAYHFDGDVRGGVAPSAAGPASVLHSVHSYLWRPLVHSQLALLGLRCVLALLGLRCVLALLGLRRVLALLGLRRVLALLGCSLRPSHTDGLRAVE